MYAILRPQRHVRIQRDYRDLDKVAEDEHFMENVDDDYQWIKGMLIGRYSL